jgi:hypothetical protein
MKGFEMGNCWKKEFEKRRIENWNNNVAMVRDFVTRHDRLPSQSCPDREERRLASWCNNKRHANALGMLSEAQKKDLEAIPHWYWRTPRRRDWMTSYQEAVKFFNENGRVPKKIYQCKKKKNRALANEKKLAEWRALQREKYLNGKLDDEKVALLDAIPGWGIKEPKPVNAESRWLKNFSELLDFVNKNNRYPYIKNDNEKRLSNWVNTQRQKRTKGELSEYKIKLMNSIPDWKWGKVSVSWHDRYNQLVKHHLDNKPLDPKSLLGIWAERQKKSWLEGKLSDEKVRLLKLGLPELLTLKGDKP